MAVYQQQSFSKAARYLRLDASKISRSIGALESELGARLFNRTTKQFKNTESGVIFYKQMSPVLEEIDRTKEEISSIKEKPKGNIKISTPVAYGLTNIIPLLPKFTQQYPEITIELVMEDLPPDWKRSSVDLALCLSPVPDPDMRCYKVTDMKSRAYVSQAYLERKGNIISPSELIKHDCISLNMPSFGTSWRFWPDSEPDLITEVEVKPLMVTSNAQAIKQMVLEGLGIGIIADWMLSSEDQKGGLTPLFQGQRASSTNLDSPSMWIVAPPRNFLPEKVRVVIDFLLKELGRASGF